MHLIAYYLKKYYNKIMNSFFIELKDVEIGDEIKLDSIEHNHLANVLRMKIGEFVQVYPNDERILICEIKSITKKESILVVRKIDIAQTNPKSRVDVFTALLKGDKFEFLITKLTELGISGLYPFESEFCIGKINGDKSARQYQIAKDACKQCKRSKTIEVGKPISFQEMLTKVGVYDLVIFAYEKEEKSSINKVLSKLKQGMKVALIIGSEGGFSQNEAKEIEKVGAVAVSLGSRILRAETASLMLSVLVLNILGEYELKSCWQKD